jgi:hypothetical protein
VPVWEPPPEAGVLLLRQPGFSFPSKKNKKILDKIKRVLYTFSKFNQRRELIVSIIKDYEIKP